MMETLINIIDDEQQTLYIRRVVFLLCVYNGVRILLIMIGNIRNDGQRIYRFKHMECPEDIFVNDSLFESQLVTGDNLPVYQDIPYCIRKVSTEEEFQYFTLILKILRKQL